MKNLVLSLDELKSSSDYVIDQNVTIPVNDIFNPVMDTLSKYTSNIKVQASHEQSVFELDDMYTSYGRVMVSAYMDRNVLGDEAGDKVVFIWALDKKKPKFIVASGYEVFACTNLFVSGSSEVRTYQTLEESLESLTKQTSESNHLKSFEMYSKFKDIKLTRPEIEKCLGTLLCSGIVKPASVVYASKALVDPSFNSLYYTPNTELSSLWNVYNSVTHHFTHNYNISDVPVNTGVLSDFLNKMY